MEKIYQRKLGKTNLSISVIGFGGLALAGLPQKQVDEIVEYAISRGVNFFDVAPTYGDAEIKLGNALKGNRDKIFLSCKTTCRTKSESLIELKNSLKNLRTDYFDFYLMHGIRDIENDVIPATGKNGMLMTAIEAKRNGIVKYIGFSSHTEKSAIFAFDQFDFDIMAFPVNLFCFLATGFGKQAIEYAKKRDAGIIALKTLAKQKLDKSVKIKKYPNCWYEPEESPEMAKIMMKWTYSQQVSSIIPPADVRLFKMALDISIEVLTTPLEPEHIKKFEEILPSITPIFPS
jgi:predicted aldo/keto reductase-like oxidoreductase